MILQGLTEVLQPMTIILIAIGTVVGIVFGSIPGLTATMAIVMFLPVTYSMTASEGISMLMALYIGGISGGLISAILLNIPGTPSSVATCFDGKPLADKGEAGKALGTGLTPGQLQQVEVLNEEKTGAPQLHLMGQLRVAALVRGVERIHVSLSHTAENAIAQVLLEG